MQQKSETHSELVISDLQRRLTRIGYRLGDEAEQGLFGEKTAAAVASFKESIGLAGADVLDQATWAALKDASMQLGDRKLYLHIPHFRGRDVGELQGALSSMGFSCAVDSSFGPETEQALRDFQDNMDLRATGILDALALEYLFRLKHVWEGKRGYLLEGRPIRLARSSEILETTPLCLFGRDEPTRVIANKMANLARSTTADSLIQSATALDAEPPKDMLLVGLELYSADEALCRSKEQRQENQNNPSLLFDNKEGQITLLAEAIREARAKKNRLTLFIDKSSYEEQDPDVQRLRIAIDVLDGLCASLDKLR